ncbi:MAG TPA: hypothetical protein VLY63_13750 [Anaerolineae bacterium]|nr:hypothetical protein [Anaerolineae bacterium]
MPYSNYSKIYDLLTELSNGDAPKDVFQLAEEIHDKEIESFAIWRPGTEPGALATKTYCSTASIRRLIRFVAELGLVEIGDSRQCSLTTYGRNALRGDNYPRVLATHVAMYLKENAGITFSELKDTIGSIRSPEVPFFDTIYSRVSSERDLQIGENRLRMVMYLLERCDMLTSITRKVYFAPEAQL